MQETWVRSLGWEDSLEKEMASHAGILAWRIQWTEEPGGLQSLGSQKSDTTEVTWQQQQVYLIRITPNELEQNLYPTIV